MRGRPGRGRRARGSRRPKASSARGGSVDALRLITLSPGAVYEMTLGDLLGEIPPRRVFRVQSIRLECASVNVTTVSPAGPLVGSACVLEMHISAPQGSGSDLRATTGPRVVGPNPRVFTLVNPPSSDWVSYSETPSLQMIGVENICSGNATIGPSGRLFGVLHIRMLIMPEDFQPACPTFDFRDAGPAPYELV